MRPRQAAALQAAADGLIGFAVLCAFWALGEGVAWLLPSFPLSGSLWGMIALFGALSTRIVPERRVRRASSFLVRWLGLLFVPVGVGVVAFAELVARHAVAITAAIVVGSLLTLLAAAAAAAWTARSRAEAPK